MTVRRTTKKRDALKPADHGRPSVFDKREYVCIFDSFCEFFGTITNVGSKRASFGLFFKRRGMRVGGPL